MIGAGARRGGGARRGAVRLAVVALAGAPALARARPFSFLSAPTDQLGVPGYVPGTLLTPSGSLYTGWAELAFRYGARLRPGNGAVRDLLGGDLPVLRYYLRTGGVDYTVTVLCALAGNEPVNFVRVLMHNHEQRAARAGWGAGLLYSGGRLESNGQRAFRFIRPATPDRTGLYTQPGVAFHQNWSWAFDGDTVTRQGEALLRFPRAPAGFTRRLTLKSGVGGRPARERAVLGEADYRGSLAAGARRNLDFAMPVVPVAPEDPGYTAIEAARFGRELADQVHYWRRLYDHAIQIALPDPKVLDTFYTSLANMALPRYPAPTGGWVQAVNKLQYNAFWLRDASFIANSLDLAGLHGLAEQDLEFFPRWQQPDGLFISRPQQYDGFGEALWAIGAHAVSTRDGAFAVQMLGPIQRAMAWFEQDRVTEPWGLMPAGTPGDDELTTGHITGDDFMAAAGIHEAIAMAGLAGRADLAQRWTLDLQSFTADLRMRWAEAEAKTGGAIPPSLEANGGEDWGNLWSSYPIQVVPAQDPAVTATLRHVTSHFREGIATYYGGSVLHGYLAFRVFETELLRGEQSAVVSGLYSELAHTTSTNGGFEIGVFRHGPRVVTDDLAPHGWFAAEYVALLRNMLVREAGNALVLMSAVSPRWLLPGARISVRNADTDRGRIDYSLTALRGGAVLRWRGSLAPGTALRWPVPANAYGVRARGLSHDEHTIALHGAAGRLGVSWRLVGPFPSFAATATRVLSQYSRR